MVRNGTLLIVGRARLCFQTLHDIGRQRMFLCAPVCLKIVRARAAAQRRIAFGHGNRLSRGFVRRSARNCKKRFIHVSITVSQRRREEITVMGFLCCSLTEIEQRNETKPAKACQATALDSCSLRSVTNAFTNRSRVNLFVDVARHGEAATSAHSQPEIIRAKRIQRVDSA